MPGEELLIKDVAGEDGGAPNNRVRLFLTVAGLFFDGVYVPSKRFPTS
jgi:hypothetical protein